ncbi:MAG TPA: PEP/pyruvate-binding domain-containing protein [Capsulimonadaceae bacterium]|jgi:pyruvate,water dikinase
MSYLIQFPGEPDGHGAVGTKAAVLAAAADAGIAVPPWFVVTSEAFSATLTREQDADLHSAETASMAAAAIAEMTFHDAINSELQTAIVRLRLDRDFLAVRPSPSADDIPAYDASGPLTTALSVRASDVPTRLVEIWKAAYAQRVLIHRRTHGLHLLPTPPAVVVQQMLRPQVSGIAFGVDLVSGRRSVSLIASVYGLSTTLTSGETDGDLYRVDRDGTIVDRNIADKRFQDRPTTEAEGGVMTAIVSTLERNRPSLTDDQVHEVVDLLWKTAQLFHCPQEIEWAFDGGKLYLLGSKPVASLDRLSDPDVEPTYWDSGNIGEFYPGVTSPLTFSFARRSMAEMARAFCRAMQVPRDRMEHFDSSIEHLIGHVRGRLYSNVRNWYRVFALLPDYPANARFYGRMSGQMRGMPTNVEQGLRQNWVGRLRMLGSAIALMTNWFRVPGMVKRFERDIAETLDGLDGNLERRRLDELVDAYTRLERRSLSSWDAPLVNDFYTIVFYGLLKHASEQWCGNADGSLVNDLLTSREIPDLTGPIDALKSIAVSVAKSAAMTTLMGSAAASHLRAKLDVAPDIDGPLAEFLHKYGDRCLAELKFESTPFRRDPEPIYRALGRLASADRSATGNTVRERAEEYVMDAIGSRPMRNAVFQWILRETEERIETRERLCALRTRLFAATRDVLLEIGKRYYALGLLDDARDILYLEIDETLGYMNGAMSSANPAAIAASRKAEYDHYAAMPNVPDRFESRGPVNLTRVNGKLAETADASKRVRQGVGCCRGTVTGQARRVDGLNSPVTSGSVVVAATADPAWVLLYPNAAGMVFAQGGQLSHGVVAARSMGIPTVVAVPGVLDWLDDGDTIEIDGVAGTVKRLQTAVPEPAPVPEPIRHAAHPMTFLGEE